MSLKETANRVLVELHQLKGCFCHFEALIGTPEVMDWMNLQIGSGKEFRAATT